MAAPREETRGLFGQGVRAVLGNWAALQIAVEHGFGGAHGREKAEWMVGAVEQYFHSNGETHRPSGRLSSAWHDGPPEITGSSG
nr:pre-rRNA-processing protein TSR2 homolog [Chrysemys picta bellii]